MNHIKTVLVAFFVWRLILFLLAIIGVYFLPEFGNKFPYVEERLISSNLPQFIWSFGNFDGVHYIGIAKDAYANQYTQAFFPFYPLIIKLFSLITFGNYVVAGLLVSNISFFISLLIFFKLISKIYSDKIALWSIIFLLSFPTSFYFGAIYTEGIFFLLLISSFYLSENKKLLPASIAGAFASSTRLIGIFLTPALGLKKNIKSLIPITVVPLGIIFYILYLQFEFNNPFYFLTAQSVWGQERSTSQIVLLPQVFWRYFKILTTTEGPLFLNALFELVSTIFAIVALFYATKIVKKEWLIFSWLAILTPTLSGTLTSMPRYIIIAFPIFVLLAKIKTIWVKLLILAIFSIGLSVTTIVFTRGYWIA